jgi:uncharacterized delta-60 repeat protein
MTLTSRIFLPLALIAAPLALVIPACDDDNTNQTGQGGRGGSTAGTTGTAGRGGSGGSGPAGMGGSGGSAMAGAGGAPTGVAGTGGAAAGGAGGTAGAAGAAGAAGTAGAAGRGGSGGAGGTAPAFIDTDTVFARFNADGTADTTFGTAGVVKLDLGTGAQVGGRDAPWGIAKDAQDRLHLFAARKNVDGRTDTDRVVVRLSANGVVDVTFGTMGFHTLNIANLSDSARHGLVQGDGKIVSVGYTSQPTGVGTQSANRIVIARLNGDAPAAGGAGGAAGAAGAGGAGGAGGAAGAAAPAAGTYDTTFGVGGIVNSNPFSSTDPLMMWGMAEAYGIARQTTGSYVTTGYGRLAPSGQVNVVCFRWSAAGVFDTTWATNGIFERDLTTDNDRGRNIIALPDDRLLIAGSLTPTAMNVDGMLMILTPNGVLDTTFNTVGYKGYKFDATNDRPDEALYDVAVSPNGMFAAAVGYRNAGTVAGNNDDAVLVILPIGGTGTEFAAAVPFSATAADRFWGVTFDANNKVVATGYVNEGGDNFLAVARFNTDGTRDTTFGTGGIAKINAAVAGTLEEARDVVVQSSGKIVIGGTVEH